LKRILVSCGVGISTSAAVRGQILDSLEAKGFGPGDVEVGQCRISELPKFAGQYDLIVTTCALPSSIHTPYVLGIAFFTGVGTEQVMNDIVSALEL